MAWRQGSPGVSAQGMCTKRVAQEPGRTLVSPRSNPGWAPGDQSPGLQKEGVRTLWERNSGRSRGTAKRRKRSAAGWSQGVVAPQKYRGSGGTIPRDPVEGRGVSGHGIVGGKDDKVAEPRECLNEASTDSATGMRLFGPEGARRGGLTVAQRTRDLKNR